MKVTFETDRYVFSTGQKPRGEGGWAFARSFNAPADEAMFAPYGSFSSAKKWAKEQAIRRWPNDRMIVLYVQP